MTAPSSRNGHSAANGVHRTYGWGIPTDMLGGLSSGEFGKLFSVFGIGDDEELTDPYVQHWAVYACVKARARAIASVPFKLWTSDADDAPEIASGPLVDLFHRPHPLLDGRLLWALTSVYMDLYGEAYWLLHGKQDGSMKPLPGRLGATIPVPGEIAVVPGNRVQVEWDQRTGLPKEFIYKAGAGRNQSYDPASVLPFVDLSSGGNPLRGTGAAEAVARRLEVDFKAEKLEMKAADNGGFPSVVVSSDMQGLTEAQLDQLEERLKSRFSNPDRNNQPAILPHGFAMQNPGWSPRDMEFPVAREWSLQAIMACFGVTKPILGITDDVNRANAREAKAVFWEDTIIPVQRELAGTVDHRFLSRIRSAGVPPGAVGSFDTSQVEALGDTLDEKIERFRVLRELGVKPEKAAELSNWEVDLTEADFDEPEPIPVALDNPPEEGEQSDERATTAHTRAIQSLQTTEARGAYSRSFEDWLDTRERGIGIKAELVQRGYLDAVKAKLRQAPQRSVSAKAMEAEARAPGDQPSEEFMRELEVLLLPVLGKWVETFAAEVGPELASTYFEAVANMAKELGVDRLVPDIDINAVAFLSNKQVKLAEGAMSTLAQEVKKTIAKELLTGDANFTLAQLGQKIEAKLEDLIDQVQIMRDRLPERAQRIARTESTSTANAGRVAEMKLAGILEHMWVSSRDAATRHSHAELDGTVVPMGQEFGRGLRWPGDPQAVAAEVVNCRCTTAPQSEFFNDLIEDVDD